MELNNIQALAVDLAMNASPIFSILGSAGTGKSTTIIELCKRLSDEGIKFEVLAPTGRAADILRQKTGYGMTIHKFLEYTSYDQGNTYKPARNMKNPFPYPLYVIIDEASMISREVWSNLLSALKDGSRVCLVGDNNQLPPIEKTDTDSVFNLCIKNYPYIKLEIKYRFGNQIAIDSLATSVLNGKLSEVMSNPNSYRLDGITDEHVINKLCKIDKYYTSGNQVISPVYKGKTGCDWINKMCQQHRIMTNNSRDLGFGFYEGDKVMGTMNCPFFTNGDIGLITDISQTDIKIDWAHSGNKVVMPRYITLFNKSYDLLQSIKLAYAVTTHKSQGGEYDNVTFIVGKSSLPIISRANLYTGVTRAKKNLVFLYDKWTLQKGLQNVNA